MNGILLPALAEPLGSLELEPLARTVPGGAGGAGSTGDRPFAVSGRWVSVVGTEAGGVDAILTPAAVLARGARVRDARCRRVTTSPLGVERELDVNGARVVERIVASRDAPVAWLEWEGRDTPLTLEWRVDPTPRGDRVDPDTAPPRWRRCHRGLWTERAGSRAIFALSRDPELEVEPQAEGGLTITARVAVPGGGLRLAVVGVAAGEDPARHLRTADRCRVAVRARQGAAHRLMQEALSVSGTRTGAEAADPGEAVDRAVVRLADTPMPAPGDAPWPWTGPGDPATRPPGSWRLRDATGIGLALLATGRRDAVRELLRFLARLADRHGRFPGGTGGTGLRFDDPDAPALFALLAARYLAWSGDLVTLGDHWDDVLRAVRAMAADDDADPGDTVLRARALAELEVAAEEVGALPSLRDAAARRPDGAARDADRPAPDGGAAQVPRDPFPWLAGGATTDGDLLVPDGWPDPLAAAGLVAGIVHGVLGAEPDAPRGRLVLRPRLAAWQRLAVRRLPVGDASVDLAYSRDGATHRITVGQARGAAPLQLVLQPRLAPTQPRQKITAIRVDGADADLDVSAEGAAWRVPVQLALDHQRTLEVEFGDADA